MSSVDPLPVSTVGLTVARGCSRVHGKTLNLAFERNLE